MINAVSPNPLIPDADSIWRTTTTSTGIRKWLTNRGANASGRCVVNQKVKRKIDFVEDADENGEFSKVYDD